MSWGEMVEELQPVPDDGITALAHAHLDTRYSPKPRQAEELWDLLGGAKGMNRMQDNSELFLGLASHVQKWSPREARAELEKMSTDAATLRRALFRAALARVLGLRKALATQVLEAAASYDLMRNRLLHLHKSTGSALYPTLKKRLEQGCPAIYQLFDSGPAAN